MSCPGELSHGQGPSLSGAEGRELRKPGKEEADPGVHVCPDNPAGLRAAGSSLLLQEGGKGPWMHKDWGSLGGVFCRTAAALAARGGWKDQGGRRLPGRIPCVHWQNVLGFFLGKITSF